ncbi:hypothetical protein D3C80_2079740 [compost metagenome]
MEGMLRGIIAEMPGEFKRLAAADPLQEHADFLYNIEAFRSHLQLNAEHLCTIAH